MCFVFCMLRRTFGVYGEMSVIVYYQYEISIIHLKWKPSRWFHQCNWKFILKKYKRNIRSYGIIVLELNSVQMYDKNKIEQRDREREIEGYRANFPIDWTYFTIILNVCQNSVACTKLQQDHQLNEWENEFKGIWHVPILYNKWNYAFPFVHIRNFDVEKLIDFCSFCNLADLISSESDGSKPKQEILTVDQLQAAWLHSSSHSG